LLFRVQLAPLRKGSNDRAFRITEVSNSTLLPKEFLDWERQMANDNRRGPLLRDVAAAEERIKRAETYRYTSEAGRPAQLFNPVPVHPQL
jgi:hypothetical protein